MAGYFGIDKTITLVKDKCIWPHLRRDVAQHVTRCRHCQITKGYVQKTGLYTTQPVPKASWVDISMKFVLGLPKTGSGYDSIFVVGDRFSKIAHFVACKCTMDASDIADNFPKKLCICMVCPEPSSHIVTPKFINHFWHTLWKWLGAQLQFSSAYHPQTDDNSHHSIISNF